MNWIASSGLSFRVLKLPLVLGLIVGGFTVGERAIADDWKLARGTPTSTGYSSERLPNNPELLWEYTPGKPAFEGTPIIAEGKVFVGDVEGTLHVLDLMTGNPIWTKSTKNGFITAGAYHEGKFMIGDFDGKIYCFAAADGEKLWEYELDQQVASGGNFFDDFVLLTSESGSMYAIDLKLGTLKWEFATGDQLRSGPTIWKHFALLGGCDGKLHKVDLNKGEAADDGGLPLDGPTGSTPGVCVDLAVVPTQSGQVLGFDLKTGTKLWTFVDAERSQEIRSSPAIATDKESSTKSGIAVITTRNRRVLGLDLSDGSMKWESILKKRSDSSVVICDGRVWVGGTDGKISAIDIQSGEERWSYQATGSLIASPAIANGRLVIPTDKGTVLCFGSKAIGAER